MRDLPTFLAAQQDISRKAYGPQRSPNSAALDCGDALGHAREHPTDLYAWVDLLMAGLEGALRSGNTPFAIAQAMLNRQSEMATKKWPHPLAHMPPPQPAGARESERRANRGTADAPLPPEPSTSGGALTEPVAEEPLS